jgi:RNA polymerase sigma factor (sigma-70 family)
MPETGPDQPQDDLIARLAAREPQALEALSSAYGRLLSRTAWCMLGDHHAAEAAVQDTLLAAWTGAAAIRPGSSLRSWLLAVLMNQCRKQQRSWTRWLRRHAGWTPPAPDPPDPRLDALRVALDEVPPAARAVVVLRYLDGRTVEDCAAILGIPAGTVKSRCHHALAHLRRRISIEDPADD